MHYVRVATRKQRKVKLRRAQHASRPRQGTGPVSEGSANLAALLTDERLLGWGRAEGLDLTNRAQLLDAVAVGITILLWRNTELENIHAGVELKTADTADVDAVTDQLDAALEADVAGYRGVADPAEAARLKLLLEHRRVYGAGIPDDVMMRCNASTARTVRAVLDDVLPAAATVSGATLSYPRDGLPVFLTAPLAALLNRDRLMTVGPVTVTASELLGERGWAVYDDDVYDKLARPAAFADAAGARAALWHIALSGATYGDGWWPAAHWAAAVADVRAALAAEDVDLVDSEPGSGRLRPNPDDDAFWAALTDEPERLNAAQARWVIGSRLLDRLFERRMATAAAVGAADTERFPALLALS